MLEDEAPPPGVERGGGEAAPSFAAGGGIADRQPIAAAAAHPPSAAPAPPHQSSAPMSLDLPESSAAAVAKQAQALADAEVRHTLYLEVRSHVLAGWDRLPSGLSKSDLRELAVMAKARGDRRMYALCSCAEAGSMLRSIEVAV